MSTPRRTRPSSPAHKTPRTEGSTSPQGAAARSSRFARPAGPRTARSAPAAVGGAQPAAKTSAKTTGKPASEASGKTSSQTSSKAGSNAAAKAGAASRAARSPAPFVSTGYWLLKTEPESFSFDALLAAPRRRTGWDGVRNYQARNFLRDSMRVGDLVLVYHSNAEPPGVAGVARVSSGPRPDPTQFDPADPHFDPDARREAPTWIEVEIEAVARAPRYVSLDELRGDARLGRMLLLQRGQRLSVQPVQRDEWRIVLERAGLDPDAHRSGA